MTHDELIARAASACEEAYVPSMCAERTAIFKAVSEGERGFELMEELHSNL